MPSLSQSQIVQLLGGSGLLRSIPAEELEKVAPQVRSSRYSANQLIFRKGDEGGGMMVVVSGRVKIVSVSPAGSIRVRTWCIGSRLPRSSGGSNAASAGSPCAPTRGDTPLCVRFLDTRRVSAWKRFPFPTS